MQAIRAWDSPAPPEVVLLTEDDLTPELVIPTWSFTERVAERVVRRGRLERPWFALIPNAGHVFEDSEAVCSFQQALMSRLTAYIKRRWPHLLRRPPFAGVSPAEAHEIYRTSRLRVNEYAFPGGLDTHRNFHMDVRSQLFVSLCCWRKEGVRGGYHRFFDALGYIRSRGIKHWDRVLTRDGVGRFNVFNDAEFAARLETGMFPKCMSHVVQLEGLNHRRDMPILVFSNRYEDGILHGVSPLTETGSYPRRSVLYCGIGYSQPQRQFL